MADRPVHLLLRRQCSTVGRAGDTRRPSGPAGKRGHCRWHQPHGQRLPPPVSRGHWASVAQEPSVLVRPAGFTFSCRLQGHVRQLQVGVQVAGGGFLLDTWECRLSAPPCPSGRVAPRTSQLVGQPPASICVTGGRRGHTRGALTRTPAPWPLGASSRL